MAGVDKLFVGSIPDIYDRYLVPLIFEGYALDLANRLGQTGARTVLEIAAGTGVLTRAMAGRLAPDAKIVATDLNQPMLDRAVASQTQDHRIEWKQAEALGLPFEDERFDAVVCQFGVMFFPDKVRGYKEAWRVLKPGGLYLFSIWDRISDNEFAEVVTEAVALLFPDDPPRFLSRTPHGYHDPQRTREELEEAGFKNIMIDVVEHRSRASSPHDAAVAYCQGTPLRNEIEARGSTRLQEATNKAAEALERRFGNGVIDGRIRAFVVAAMR